MSLSGGPAVPIEIDRAHPLAPRCLAAWPLRGVPGGRVADAVSRRAGAMQGTWSALPDRLALAGSGYAALGTRSEWGAVDFTICVTVYPTVSAVFQCVIGRYESGVSGWLLVYTSDQRWRMDGRESTDAYLTSGVSGICAPGRPYRVVGRKVGTEWSVWVDGQVGAAQAQGSGDIAFKSTIPATLGALLNPEPAFFVTGWMRDIALYRGGLTAQQIAADARDPTAIYRRRALWAWPWSGASAAGASLSGTAAGTGTAAADLATAIAAAGSVLGAGLAVAGLSSEIALAAAALGDGSASAALATRILLAAGSAGSGGSGAASAELATQVRLAAEVLGAALISGSLTTAIRLGGTVLGAGTVRAQLAAHGVHLRAAESRMARVPARRGTLAVPVRGRIVRVRP